MRFLRVFALVAAALLLVGCQSSNMSSLSPEVAAFSPNLPANWQRNVSKDQISYSCNFRRCTDYGSIVFARMNLDNETFVDKPDKVIRSQYYKDYLTSRITSNMASGENEERKVSYREIKSGLLQGYELSAEGKHSGTGKPFGIIGRVILGKNGNFMLVALGKDLPQAHEYMQIALAGMPNLK